MKVELFYLKIAIIHICYDLITEDDIDGNGFQEHEFTPESSYYISNGTGNNNVCGAMSSPIEPDR